MKKNLFFTFLFPMILAGLCLAATDPNGDGVANGLDRALGTTPAVHSGSPVRGGAILVDTGHGEYMSTSSCTVLFANLQSHGYTAVDFGGTITASALAGYDVLCIGTPRANSGVSFDSSEITAIVDFVNNGGGLMISGDYYNPPYNDNVKANSVAGSFGITYNQDSGNPTWPTITDFTGHDINTGISGAGYYGWCTAALSGTAAYLAFVNSVGAAETNEVGQGRVFSLHDWNLYSDGYVKDYDNLAWVTQGILWAAGEAISPILDVKCNGGDAGVRVPQGTNAKVDYSVVAGTAAGLPVDLWVVMRTPFGFFSYDGIGPYSGWNYGLSHVFYTGGLIDVSGTALDQPLPLGAYKAFIGVDTVPDGVLTLGSILKKDAVDFTVY